MAHSNWIRGLVLAMFSFSATTAMADGLSLGALFGDDNFTAGIVLNIGDNGGISFGNGNNNNNGNGNNGGHWHDNDGDNDGDNGGDDDYDYPDSGQDSNSCNLSGADKQMAYQVCSNHNMYVYAVIKCDVRRKLHGAREGNILKRKVESMGLRIRCTDQAPYGNNDDGGFDDDGSGDYNNNGGPDVLPPVYSPIDIGGGDNLDQYLGGNFNPGGWPNEGLNQTPIDPPGNQDNLPVWLPPVNADGSPMSVQALQ